MTVLRPILVGLAAGAAVAFLAALLGPRRRREPIDLSDPPASLGATIDTTAADATTDGTGTTRVAATVDATAGARIDAGRGPTSGPS